MIHESLAAWLTATNSLLLILDNRDEDNRDMVIKQVESLLDERDELQLSFQGDFTNEDQAFRQTLLQLEKNLHEKLNVFTKDIRHDISEHQKKRDSSNAYTDPYSQVFRGGTFYDKKK